MEGGRRSDSKNTSERTAGLPCPYSISHKSIGLVSVLLLYVNPAKLARSGNGHTSSFIQLARIPSGGHVTFMHSRHIPCLRGDTTSWRCESLPRQVGLDC